MSYTLEEVNKLSDFELVGLIFKTRTRKERSKDTANKIGLLFFCPTESGGKHGNDKKRLNARRNSK